MLELDPRTRAVNEELDALRDERERVEAHSAWSGGDSYLGRNVPFYGGAKPGPRGAFNNAIVRAGQVRGEVARDGEWALAKLSDACVPDPAYSYRLP